MRANCAWCYRVILASTKFDRTECCMHYMLNAECLRLVPLTVNRSILADLTLCADGAVTPNCMSFLVCLKMCATAWSYQWNHCGFAMTGGYISTLTNWDVSYEVTWSFRGHPIIFFQCYSSVQSHFVIHRLHILCCRIMYLKKLKGETWEKGTLQNESLAWQEEIGRKCLRACVLKISNNCKSVAAVLNHRLWGLHAGNKCDKMTLTKMKTEKMKCKCKRETYCASQFACFSTI